MSSAWITSGLLRTVVARPADCEGLMRLVDSSACQRGSGGAMGAAALATWATPAAGAEPAATTSWPAQGAGPSTSTVSNLMTSTGQPSAATMTDGVSGFRKSTLRAGGRMTQVCSWTSKTSGQSFSQESQTMQPGAIQTFVTTLCVSAIRTAAARRKK